MLTSAVFPPRGNGTFLAGFFFGFTLGFPLVGTLVYPLKK